MAPCLACCTRRPSACGTISPRPFRFTVDGDDNAGLIVQHGKGNKRRLIPLTDGALDALRDWLSVRGDRTWAVVRADQPGRPAESRATDELASGLQHAGEAGQKADVKEFSPHDLRRTFISDLLDEGADIATVQKLAGHANVTTTAKYDRRASGRNVRRSGYW